MIKLKIEKQEKEKWGQAKTGPNATSAQFPIQPHVQPSPYSAPHMLLTWHNILPLPPLPHGPLSGLIHLFLLFFFSPSLYRAWFFFMFPVQCICPLLKCSRARHVILANIPLLCLSSSSFLTQKPQTFVAPSSSSLAHLAMEAFAPSPLHSIFLSLSLSLSLFLHSFPPLIHNRHFINLGLNG